MKLSQGPVLITGASGLIGSALSDHLQATYPSLVVHHLTRNKIKKSRWHTVHLERMDRVRSLLETIRPKIVFHCAGSTDSSQEESLFRDNVFATYQLLSACEQSPAMGCRVVLLGSAAEYGAVPPHRQPIRERVLSHPESSYGLSKHLQTQCGMLFARWGIDVIHARLFNFLHEYLPPTFAFANFLTLIQNQRASSTPQTVGDLSAIRDYLSLKDVCRALVAIAERGHSGEVYNVCSGVGVSMKELLAEMMRCVGAQFQVKETVIHTRSSVSRSVGDPHKLMRHTGWKPTRRWQEVVREILKARAGGSEQKRVYLQKMRPKS